MYAYQLKSVSQKVELKELPIPKASKNGVVVKILTTPILSYSDVYLQGKLPYMMPPMPFTPGTNAIGIVHEVGESVLSLKVGQKVFVESYWVKDEAVEEQGEALIGLTGISPDSFSMLEEYPNGTWREYADFPASVVHPLDGLDFDPVLLSALAKIVVPFGGLSRIGLKAGETIIINGATGYFGSAAVLSALALGANVVATGRNESALISLKQDLLKSGERVKLVVQKGEEETDITQLRQVAGNGAHAALCIIGQATDSHSTQVTLQALKRGGRMVLMGSMTSDLKINYGQMLLNNWEIKGNFMYKHTDVQRVISLVKNGLIDLNLIKTKTFNYQEIYEAISAASKVKGLENVVLKFE